MVVMILVVMPMVVMILVVMPMVIMIVMIFVIMVIMVIMIVGSKGSAFTEIQLCQPMAFHQLYRCCVGRDAFDRFFKEGFEVMAHPEHQVGILKLPCL